MNDGRILGFGRYRLAHEYWVVLYVSSAMNNGSHTGSLCGPWAYTNYLHVPYSTQTWHSWYYCPWVKWAHMNYSPTLVPPDAVLAIPSQFASLNAMSPCGDIVIWPCSLSRAWRLLVTRREWDCDAVESMSQWYKEQGFRGERKAQTGQKMRGILDCSRGRRIQDWR